MDSLLQWLEMPLDSWLACAAVLLLGAFVQRATGFGLAVVGAPLLLMIEPRLVPVQRQLRAELRREQREDILVVAVAHHPA